MNINSGDFPALPEFIFCSPVLHARFTIAIELLVRMAVAAQDPMTTRSLSQSLAQPVAVLRPILGSLRNSGLIGHTTKNNGWHSRSPLDSITLADIFISVRELDKAKGAGSDATAAYAQPKPQRNVELLLMQATVAINQLVIQHLQSFNLGRLTSKDSRGLFFRSSLRDFAPESV